ncbi:MAG: molybdopterin oxidoreductase [Phycisphaerae bacterium]|nr:MAG: molybdopterin oxidoreductase [Phycisphaerae bacterium]
MCTPCSPIPLKSRRQFLAGGALLGSGILSPLNVLAGSSPESAVLNSDRPDAPYEPAKPENTIYSACLQCNTGCGIKCKIQNGIVTKIDGNPYNPWTLLPHLPYKTPVEDAQPVDGALCPKGQSGIQTAYDPYRIRKVLKRAGRRGENKWITISFNDAIREICEGGKLFAHVPGEESRVVPGLRESIVLTDPQLAKSMETDVQAILDEKDKNKKSQQVQAFKLKYKDHLHLLIDPEHPDLGPKNNQIVVAWGRLKDGRGDFYKRFAAAMGTVNAHGHTTVCQGSLYFTCKAISEQYKDGKFTDGKKFYWMADTENSRFVLFVGANLFEANYGPPNRTVRLTGNLVSGYTKIAVADPRFSKLASKAWKWLALKPGTDAAVAMAMIRWIIEQKSYDANFLACANKAAAVSAGESSWTNATWLVSVKNGKPGKLVRAADVIIDGKPLAEPVTKPTSDGKGQYTEKFFVVLNNGQPVAVDPNDPTHPVRGDLFVDTTLPDGTLVKTGLQILYESACQKTIEEWAAIADVKASDIIDVARELTRYGKQAAVDIHRGPAQHTNGFYNVLSWMSLNMLLGNFDAKGGMIKATTWDTKGKGKLFDLTAHPGAIRPFGISSIRHGINYEKTTLFSGYPAKRNWYPLSSDVYEEIIPSIGDQYPYPVKALFTYMGAPNYALPAGHTNTEILCDLEKVPLYVANDILIGSTSMYADYIFPDLSFLERWEFQGSHPCVAQKVQPVRQPVIPPIPENCTVFGQSMPLSLEAMILGIAEYLKLPGFGNDAFGQGLHLKHPDELYLRGVANLAFGEKTDGSQNVPDADPREIDILIKARRHLPKTVFDPERWKTIVGPRMWPKVAYVLVRGGRYEDHEQAYNGSRVAHPYGALLNLYQEKTALTIHSGTGNPHPGHACYVPVMDYLGNDPQPLREGHDLALITHRVISQTKSRTIADPWLSALLPENGVLLNPRDADRLGLRNGQSVRVVSATNPQGIYPLGNNRSKPMVGKVVVTQTVRPGVISFALGFGHWATGASRFEIDGHVIEGEDRRTKGIHANAAMWTDPTLRNTCMFDPVGGSVSFYDTTVRLEPVEV